MSLPIITSHGKKDGNRPAQHLKVPMAAPNMRIGLLGGSFNPAHAAHRQISLAALKRLRLDQVWWLVSPNNPLKAKAPDLETRIAVAREVAHHPKIVVTGFEAGLSSPFTVDTIRFLKRRYPSVNFVWLMGADNLAQFHLWKDWREIAAEMPIAVVNRPGYDDGALASPAMAWLRAYRLTAAEFRNRDEWSAPALIELRFDPDPRSATELRRTDPDWSHRFTGPPLRDGVTHSLIHEPPVSGRARKADA